MSVLTAHTALAAHLLATWTTWVNPTPPNRVSPQNEMHALAASLSPAATLGAIEKASAAATTIEGVGWFLSIPIIRLNPKNTSYAIQHFGRTHGVVPKE